MISTALAWIHTVLSTAKTLAMLVYVYCAHYLSNLRPPPPTWKITRALVFCEDAELPDIDFADVTAWFTPATWKEDIGATFPGWTHWKLEVRYEFRGKPFRAVVRQNESFEFPPCDADDASQHHHSVRAPRGILAAHLVPRKECTDAKSVDVTKRLQKYEGVLRDFGARKLRSHDIFPFDDNEYAAERFDTLQILRTHPEKIVAMQTVDFARNGDVN